jgi:hypothetical protein
MTASASVSLRRSTGRASSGVCAVLVMPNYHQSFDLIDKRLSRDQSGFVVLTAGRFRMNNDHFVASTYAHFYCHGKLIAISAFANVLLRDE